MRTFARCPEAATGFCRRGAGRPLTDLVARGDALRCRHSTHHTITDRLEAVRLEGGSDPGAIELRVRPAVRRQVCGSLLRQLEDLIAQYRERVETDCNPPSGVS